MKLLLDACVWSKAADQLRDAGYDVVWSGDWSSDPGDEAILSTAAAEQRVLVTIDKDFGELAVLRGIAHCGILRIVNFSARRHAEVCITVLDEHGQELSRGALVTAEPGRIRIRHSTSILRPNDNDSHNPGRPLLLGTDVLSERNWQRAVIEAIESLPPDIRESVGYSPPTARTVDVAVSVEPIDYDDRRESHVARVEITWWQTMREQGWPREFDELYGPGGAQEEQADWPVISIDGPATHYRQGLFPGRSTVEMLQGYVQVTILEEMFCGGGYSLISKDKKDRYVRLDGTPILAWQFPKRKRRKKRKNDPE